MENVVNVLEQVAAYSGKHTIEIVLVINNFDADLPPVGINHFKHFPISLVLAPSARKPGEVIIMSARALGVYSAISEITIHVDCDCKINNINKLIDWYVENLNNGYDVAYSHVGYDEIRSDLSVYTKILIHHLSRWFKRVILGIPTTRGSNYAIKKSLFLKLYEQGKLRVDLQVGPQAKLAGKKIIYSGKKDLQVLTSARRFKGGWYKLFKYMRYRLKYNINATPTANKLLNGNSWEGFDKESDYRNSENMKL